MDRVVSKAEFRRAMGIAHKQDLTVWSHRYGLDLSKYRNEVDLVEVVKGLLELLEERRAEAEAEQDLERVKLAEEVQKLRLGNHQAETSSKQLAMEHLDAQKTHLVFLDLHERLQYLAEGFRKQETIRGSEAQEQYNETIAAFTDGLEGLIAG